MCKSLQPPVIPLHLDCKQKLNIYEINFLSCLEFVFEAFCFFSPALFTSTLSYFFFFCDATHCWPMNHLSIKQATNSLEKHLYLNCIFRHFTAAKIISSHFICWIYEKCQKLFDRYKMLFLQRESDSQIAISWKLDKTLQGVPKKKNMSRVDWSGEQKNNLQA